METIIIILLPLLVHVESGGDFNALGDCGKAKGCLQLWEIYVDDVNRIYKTAYVHDDAFDMYKAHEITFLYLMHYGKRYEKLTGKTATIEVLSRIHNGGPDGWKNPKTEKYWKKVLDFQNKSI